MYLQESKKPKWKEKEERYKAQSFDASLAELGTNAAFLNALEIDSELKSPAQSEIEDEIKNELKTEVKSKAKACAVDE